MFLYSATPTSKPDFSLKDNNKVLLQGLIIDVIDEHTSGTLQADERHDDVNVALQAGMFTWHQEAAKIFESLEHGGCKRQPDDTAFWRTLCADISHPNNRAPPSYGDEYHQLLNYQNLFKQCSYDAFIENVMAYTRNQETLISDFMDSFLIAAHERKFCSTKQKRLGLVPRMT